MTSSLTEEQKQKIREAAKDGRLPCAMAFRLADELKVPVRLIGDFCNEENIRIKNC